jgi:hypothetical protein
MRFAPCRPNGAVHPMNSLLKLLMLFKESGNDAWVWALATIAIWLVAKIWRALFRLASDAIFARFKRKNVSTCTGCNLAGVAGAPV